MTVKTPKKQNDFITDVSVDCVMFGFHGYQLKVLLLKWPGMSGWMLPRGPVKRSEPIMDAALRMLNTTTGLDDIFVQQFQTFSHPAEGWQPGNTGSDQMPAHLFPSLIAVGYYALVDFEKVRPSVDGIFQWCG